MIPDGWNLLQLNDLSSKISDGLHSTPKYTENSDYHFINGNNLKNGSVVIGKTTKCISKEEAQKHKKGLTDRTILMSINGTIGNLAYYRGEKVVLGKSAAYINIKDSANRTFIYYALADARVQSFFMSELTGTTIRNLSLKSIKASKILTPPLPEQKKIAQILSTWDKAIESVEKLIANSQQKKKALMQQLLTGKKRFPGFDVEWKKIEMGKLLEYKQPTPFLVRSTKYSDEYATPVLTAGKTFVLGHTNESFGVYEEGLPVIIFDDFTTASKFVDFPFKAKSSAMKILTAKQGVSIKYIFEAMQMINYSVGGHQRHWISIFSNLIVSLPSIEEQQKISSALSSADQEIKTWQQELAYLKQEKKALMQQLLTGKRRVKIDEALS